VNIIFLAKDLYPKNNPQAILLRNLLSQFSKYKNINIHVFTTTKIFEKTDGIKYKFYSLSINRIWKLIDKIPFFNQYLFFRFKYKNQLKIIKKYIIKNNINGVISFSNPFILNVISHYISTDLKIKNIIHYSDPIYKTIYKKSFFLLFRDFFLKFLEKKILLNASHIIINNYQMAKFIFNNQNINLFYKSSIIPHSYDKNHYKIKNNNNLFCKKKNITFSFFGDLNKIRNPILMIKSIIELKLKKIIPDNIIFLFYGNLDSFLIQKINKIKIVLHKNRIFFFRPISFIDSIKKMFDTDILVSIDARNKESIYLTSKNIFYLPIKKLVLNITQKHSPNYFFGQRAGYLFSNVLDFSDIKKKIVKSISIYKNFKANSAYINEYSSEVVARKWYKILNKVYI
jgi:hypothetical protein